MGWPGIYNICFSQLDGGKDSFPLDGVFSAFIVIGLLRDREQLLKIILLPSLVRFGLIYRISCYWGIILLPLLVRFSLIYGTWAFQIVHAIGSWGKRTGLPFWASVRAPSISSGLSFPWA